jgi:anaphase-promoting complex subunit 5
MCHMNFISNTLHPCLLFVQHYLSYLNCLRVKEFCGAIDSLLHCFDRNSLISDSKGNNNNQEEKSRAFRYAALNLAVLHAQFEHK